MRPPWPPTAALVVLAAVALAGAVVAGVLSAPTYATALPLAAAFGLVAVVVARGVDGSSDALASEPRRMAPEEERLARDVVGRRPVVLRALGALAVLVGLGSIGALWRFGPRRPPGTGWADGVRAIDAEGMPVRADDLPPGGIVTVWPEGRPDEELAAVVVLKLSPPGATAGGDAPVLAYSRICTHAGCPVALFRADEGTLYCPCHQATFDARRDAAPTFGPASRPLPRLPVGTDDDGYLVARGELSGPPGPHAGGTV